MLMDNPDFIIDLPDNLIIKHLEVKVEVEGWWKGILWKLIKTGSIKTMWTEFPKKLSEG